MHDSIAGAILGCAVGDAIGLPYEGLSARRGRRLYGEPDRHRFLFGGGMVSDDTEHTCIAAQALCEHPDDPERFARALGRRFRWWLLGLPAGIGSATLRATLKLCVGFPPHPSGVFSAGNGPAMRSGVLGAAIDEPERLRAFVAASTRLTHTDPKALEGAMAVALAAWCARRGFDTPTEFFTVCRAEIGECSTEFGGLLKRIEDSIGIGATTEQFAGEIGKPGWVSGYVYRTVPVCLHAWLRHPRDLKSAVATVIRCGGDADTTAAIVGSVVGSGVGLEGVPADWLAGVRECPRSIRWMRRLAEMTAAAAASRNRVKPPELIPLVGLGRNLVFLAAVLGHAGRRLLPPY